MMTGLHKGWRPFFSLKSSWCLLAILCIVFSLYVQADGSEQTCSIKEQDKRDPNLKEMVYDVGDGPKSFWAYVEPDITSFYPEGTAPASTKVVPKFEGLAAKFINMSKERVTLFWEGNGHASAMKDYQPFTSSGTASFPTHHFFFTPTSTKSDTSKKNRLIEFDIGEYPDNIYVYDPYLVPGDEPATEANLKANLTPQQRKTYEKWRKNLSFNEQYKNFTGRSYLSNYPRDPPRHFMWPADHFGQEHWVTSREIHFDNTLPTASLIDPIMAAPKQRIRSETDPIDLVEYRDAREGALLNMTLRVLSCSPRVLEIPNFLSEAEVRHVLELAQDMDLSESTTGDVKGGGKPDESNRQKTRTSFNSWVPRERTAVVDAIYRRSADLLRIDEALLRSRDKSEYPDWGSQQSISEALQLVHYGLTQEYTAHHDFGYGDIEQETNEARFATLLFYLNDGMKGGETSFPRYGNAETFRRLSVTPEVGKAVLFYSLLPDGNRDDFSQHAAEPIKEGEKWLINLWVWDPIYGR